MESSVVTVEQAKELLKQEQQERVEKCAEAIRLDLQKFGCQLIAVPQIQDGRIVANVTIVPVQGG